MMTLTASYADRPAKGRLLLGIAVSLAVHLLFVLGYRGLGPAAPMFAPDDPRPIAVTIRPLPPPETPPEEAPKFDMEAARRIARENAHLRDPGKEGTALSQFPEEPLQTESKLARAIGKAKRRNCKDGIPGGLLAPLYLMMDKKNSGCKW
jgi:hypothetical protein